MNKYQHQKFEMEKGVASYIDGLEAGVTSGLPNFASVYAAYKANLKAMIDLTVLQLLNRKGARQLKDGRRRELEDAANDVVARIASYANNVNNLVLLGCIDYTPSELSRSSATLFVSHCRNIHAKALEYLDALGIYGLDALVLGKFSELTDKFFAVIPKPREGIKIKKGATKDIKSTFLAGDLLLEQMDLLVGMTVRSNPGFHNEYFLARRIDQPGYRTLALRGSVVDEDGVAVGFVMMTCKKLKMKKKIGKSGNFKWHSVVDGMYEVLFERPGYVPVEMTIAVQLGVRREVRVVMVAV